MTNRPFAQDLVVEARGAAVEPPRRKHHRLRTIVILILLGGTAYGAYANIHHEATAAGASAPSASATAILGVRTAQAKI
jgi:multidrug efflux system membrane fusion protein